MLKSKKLRFARSSFVRAIICAVVLFFACIFHIGGSFKEVTMLVMAAAFVALVIKFVFYRKSMSPSLMLLIFLTFMGALSSLWAISGKFALEELCKSLFALCCALLLILITAEKGKANTRSLTTALALCTAVLSFLSIDALSTRIFTSVLKIVPGQYFDNLAGVEPGVRMVSILHFPNVFAGCAGIGVLLGLGNAVREEEKKKHIFELCCFFVNSVGFVLAFSMGASAAIAVAFVVYIVFEYKDNRARLVSVMLLTLVFAALNMAIISAFSFDRWDGFDLLPLVSLAVCCALYCFAEIFLRHRIERLLTGKAFVAIVLVFVVLAAGYIAAALNITGPVYINSNEVLSRAAYPAPGEYTLNASCSNSATVRIKSQNRVETMMHTYSVLYEGDLESASFEVPDDSLVVYFEISSDETITIDSLSYLGTKSGSIPLDYKLLPNFIANRLQGLKANQNAIQRLVFFEDGMKLFGKSPVIGHGLGAFGSAVKSVQSFYYETNYVHNHYIQSLLETGIIGLILFAALLILSFVSALKARKRSVKSVPMLCALIAFMAVHASTEVVFSSAFYLVLAFGVFTVCGLDCSHSESLTKSKVYAGITAFCAAFILVFGVLFGMNMSAESMARKNATFSTMEKAVKIDVFEWEDYALSYVMASISTDVDMEQAQKADKYAKRLSAVKSNTIHLNLTAYYLAIGDVNSAMNSARTHMRYCASSSEDWSETFEMLMSAYGMYGQYPEFSDGISELVSMMKAWDEANIGSITLSESAQLFAARYE